MTPEQRERVLDEAFSWERTPYINGARIKGVGVDCAQFPAACYEAADVIAHVEPTYPFDWHLHRDEERFIGWVLKVGGREIAEADAQPADLVLWRYGRSFSHGGVIVAGTAILHAALETEMVSLDDWLSHEQLRTRPRRFFTLGV